jgi:hypothetical protein
VTFAPHDPLDDEGVVARQRVRGVGHA